MADEIVNDTAELYGGAPPPDPAMFSSRARHFAMDVPPPPPLHLHRQRGSFRAATDSAAFPATAGDGGAGGSSGAPEVFGEHRRFTQLNSDAPLLRDDARVSAFHWRQTQALQQQPPRDRAAEAAASHHHRAQLRAQHPREDKGGLARRALTQAIVPHAERVLGSVAALAELRRSSGGGGNNAVDYDGDTYGGAHPFRSPPPSLATAHRGGYGGGYGFGDDYNDKGYITVAPSAAPALPGGPLRYADAPAAGPGGSAGVGARPAPLVAPTVAPATIDMHSYLAATNLTDAAADLSHRLQRSEQTRAALELDRDLLRRRLGEQAAAHETAAVAAEQSAAVAGAELAAAAADATAARTALAQERAAVARLRGELDRTHADKAEADAQSKRLLEASLQTVGGRKDSNHEALRALAQRLQQLLFERDTVITRLRGQLSAAGAETAALRGQLAAVATLLKKDLADERGARMVALRVRGSYGDLSRAAELSAGMYRDSDGSGGNGGANSGSGVSGAYYEDFPPLAVGEDVTALVEGRITHATFANTGAEAGRRRNRTNSFSSTSGRRPSSAPPSRAPSEVKPLSDDGKQRAESRAHSRRGSLAPYTNGPTYTPAAASPSPSPSFCPQGSNFTGAGVGAGGLGVTASRRGSIAPSVQFHPAGAAAAPAAESGLSAGGYCPHSPSTGASSAGAAAAAALATPVRGTLRPRQQQQPTLTSPSPALSSAAAAAGAGGSLSSPSSLPAATLAALPGSSSSAGAGGARVGPGSILSATPRQRALGALSQRDGSVASLASRASVSADGRLGLSPFKARLRARLAARDAGSVSGSGSRAGAGAGAARSGLRSGERAALAALDAEAAALERINADRERAAGGPHADARESPPIKTYAFQIACDSGPPSPAAGAAAGASVAAAVAAARAGAAWGPEVVAVAAGGNRLLRGTEGSDVTVPLMAAMVYSPPQHHHQTARPRSADASNSGIGASVGTFAGLSGARLSAPAAALLAPSLGHSVRVAPDTRSVLSPLPAALAAAANASSSCAGAMCTAPHCARHASGSFAAAEAAEAAHRARAAVSRVITDGDGSGAVETGGYGVNAYPLLAQFDPHGRRVGGPWAVRDAALIAVERAASASQERRPAKAWR